MIENDSPAHSDAIGKDTDWMGQDETGFNEFNLFCFIFKFKISISQCKDNKHQRAQPLMTDGGEY